MATFISKDQAFRNQLKDTHGFIVKEVIGGGDRFYESVALACMGSEEKADVLRRGVVAELISHADFYRAKFPTFSLYANVVTILNELDMVGHLEILATTRAIKKNIKVHFSEGFNLNIRIDAPNVDTIHLSHHYGFVFNLLVPAN